MFKFLKNPHWIHSRLATETNIQDLPPSLFDEVKEGLSNFQSSQPVVSVVIPALNEEFTILRTLQSLSRNKTNYPVEIIVVNNNSTDRTQEVLDRLNVRNYFQGIAGWGPARQMGLEKARGKYVLSADADSFYPEEWIERMTTALANGNNISCVYGDYSYLGTDEYPRWQFLMYESVRSVIRSLRQIKRPHLNARGISMGFVKELGVKKGFVNRKIKGEDGRMCFELMQLGKVVRLRSRKAVVWTLPRHLKADGGLFVSFLTHGFVELLRFRNYFKTPALHDTHLSTSSSPDPLKYFKKTPPLQPDAKIETGSGPV